jgi:glycosyltransferase involved in cell wall biosynthesis
VTRRILLITPFAPSSAPRHGSARAIRGLTEALAARHELVVLHLDDENDVDPALAARCAGVHAHAIHAGGPWANRIRGAGALVRGRTLWTAELGISSLQRRVRELCRTFQPDVVQAEQGIVGEALAGAPPGTLRLVTIHEPALNVRDSVRLRREGLRAAHRIDAVAAMRQERRVLALADAAVVFTERDRRALAASAPPTTTLATIPLGWEVPPEPLDPVGANPPAVTFIGSFRHPPNVDAAVSLARRILPLVRAARPDATLQIVGEGPPLEVRALAGDSVRLAADVVDVTPYLDRAAVVAAPIAIGGGTRVKVLEALAAGKAVVASPRATEGVGARNGVELLVAEGDAETASAIIRLLEDEPARRAMAGRARAWAERELSWSTMAARYEELYARLADRPGVPSR